MYPGIADNVPRLPPSRLWDVHQPVMSPRIGFSGPLAAWLTGSQAHHSCLLSRSSSFPIPYPNWVAYLGTADNVSRLLPSPLSDVPQPVIHSRNPFTRPHAARLACL